MTPKLPTDLQLLGEIYEKNYRQFASYSEESKSRASKIWVPIDIEELASKFRLDPDIIFGRLYYHLNDKFSHKSADGSKTEFFALRIGADKHCVNFPYLSSVLSSLQDENKKFLVATGVAVLSLIISIISIVIATLS